MKKPNTYLLFLLLLISIPQFIYSDKNIIPPGKLKMILKNTSEYCEKLKTMVFHCFCTEKIKESFQQSLYYPKKSGKLQSLSHFLKRSRRSARLPTKVRRFKSVYESQYQLILARSKIKENRFLLKRNGKVVSEKNAKLSTIIYSRNGPLAPLFFFDKHQQDKFNYKLLRRKEIMNHIAYEIEVKLKNKIEEKSPYAVIWVDVNDFSILKFEAFPESLQGYDFFVRKSETNIENVKVSNIHYFGYKRDNVRFPTKTSIELSYTGVPQTNLSADKILLLGYRKLVKIKTIFTYDKYHFFKATVDDPVFKDLSK